MEVYHTSSANGNSIDSGLSIENRDVHIPAKWKTNIWTIDDHGFSPACMKQKCFRTCRAFCLVSVFLLKKMKCFSRDLPVSEGSDIISDFWWLRPDRHMRPDAACEHRQAFYIDHLQAVQRYNFPDDLFS